MSLSEDKGMGGEERQFLLTVAWMFMRHGQRPRAQAVCEALVENDPRDGVAAVALAELLLDDASDAERALSVLREADVPDGLSHAAAMLETRALKLLGRASDARSRWTRYLESRKGAARRWVE